jgi:phage terminase large subunit
LRNNSQIYFFGLDDPLKIQSLNLGACGVDEVIELTEDDWIMLGGRIRLSKVPFRQLFAATNPAHQGHWCYQRFYIERPFLPDGRPMTEVIESNALENPHLPADYMSKIQTLSGRYRDRFVLGKWVSFEGLVYDCFDPLVHVVSTMTRGWQEWPKVRSIDFGYANPFVCQWWAISPDDEWYLYRELYHSRRLVEDHARQINELSRGETYLATYADHDAEDRATLEKYGIRTMPAVKDVSPGIQEVYKKLQIDDRGKPGLCFLRSSLMEKDPALVEEKKPTCTLEEIQGYQYPKQKGDKNVKEEPIKLNDHGMDCMRYAVYSFVRRLAVRGAPGGVAGKTESSQINW